MHHKANYSIVHEETNDQVLTIRDDGPWNEFQTVTNATEKVVTELYETGLLHTEQKLLYYDSDGDLDEIVHLNGRFVAFRAIQRK